MTAEMVTRAEGFTARGGGLLDALAAVRPFVSTGVRAGEHERVVLLDVDDVRGVVSCSTGEVSARSFFAARSTSALRAVVRHADLWKAARSLSARTGPRAEVEVAVEMDQDCVVLSAEGSGEVRVSRLEESVMLGRMHEPAGSLIVDREPVVAFWKAGRKMAVRPGHEPAILSGVHLVDDTMTVTDRHRLAQIHLSGTGELREAVVPAATLAKVASVVRGECIVLGSDGVNVSVHTGNFSASLRTLPGQYAKVGRVIDVETPMHLEVDRAALLEAVKGLAGADVAVAVEGQGDGVALEITRLRDGEDRQVLARQRLTARERSEEVTPFVLASTYLVDALEALSGPMVRVRGRGPLQAWHLSDPQNDDHVVIVQPIRLASQSEDRA